MSRSQGGMITSSFIKSRMLSSTGLKLFSFALRLTSRLNVPYISSAPLTRAMWFMSSWYWAVSSATVRVRKKPSGGFCSWGFTRPVKSFISLPPSSFTSMISHPLTYTKPYFSAAFGFRPPSNISATSAPLGGLMVSRNSTSCSLSSSHSARMLPLRFRVSMTMSAVTAAGLNSPTAGLRTSVILNTFSGSAMRAQPANLTTGTSPLSSQ
mmetsp:Transcript_22334/g.61747  ORF Transcript_22334/g.61747 Transcript_22334/m.61747 type:complete len:210 (-) Transcript_22334:1043-1672(-)